MSASAPAYGGGYPTDELQALMSGNWTFPPPNRLPFTNAIAYQSSSFSRISTAEFPSQLPVSPNPVEFSAAGSSVSVGVGAGSGSGSGSGPGATPGFGSFSASALGPTLLLAAESATAAPPPIISGNDTTITSTSTSTPTLTPRPYSTLAGLARQQTQAFAALHSTFVSPHFFSNTAFATHLPDIHFHDPPRLPSTNDFFDHFTTADIARPPNGLPPLILNPTQQRVFHIHDLRQSLCPVGSSSVSISTPTPHQFGLGLQAPNLAEEGLDLPRDVDNITLTHEEEENSSAQNVQEREEHEEEGDLHIDDQARIAVTSLLDASMPAVATSRKRNRPTAALDEVAGPATIKRPRSESNGVGVSSKRPSKPSRPVPPVVNLDSDPFAIDDDEGRQELFDLTENDALPEANKVIKEDTSTKLCKFECIICLDAASTLTVTHCGHMFCGPCLHQAMHAEVTKKICPMCRQKLDTRPKNAQPAKAAKTFFHLEMKLKLSKSQGKQPVRPVRR